MPRVSVLISAYYSSRTLRACLDSLREQTLRDFETIVVNSSPELETRAIVRDYPEARIVQSCERLFPHAAHNRGAELAAGAALAFIDPDCVARADWLEQLVGAQDAGHPIVAGLVLPRHDEPLPWTEHLVKFHMVLGLEARPCLIAPTTNACLSRGAWDRLGPLDEAWFAGDALLSRRAHANLVRPWFEPKAVVLHDYRADPPAFVRERYERGRDFASARLNHDAVSRTEALVLAAALPLRLTKAVALIAKNSVSAGAGHRLIGGLPLMVAAQAAWSVAETVDFGRYALTASRPAPARPV